MPNQALHIVGGNTANASPGINWTDGDQPLDIDADGVMVGTATYRRLVIDLSECLGYRLGKQIPMTANFRINYLRVGLRNVDDMNDNDDTQYFTGTWEWYAPSKHRIDGVQAWRRLEKALEATDADSEGLFVPTNDHYKGFRFGWVRASDVSHPTLGAPAALADGYALAPMIAIYNGGLKSNGVPSQDNAVWDRMVGRSSKLQFTTHVSQQDNIASGAVIEDGVWHAPAGHNIEVMGGLLALNFEYSSTDTTNTIDDNFEVVVDIGVSGWSSW